jgi:hypothetical protein
MQYTLKTTREGYEQSNAWSPITIRQFIQLQNSINPKIIFDTNQTQKQATEEEAIYFLSHGYWPWKTTTEDLYKSMIKKNPYILTDPEDSMNYVKTIYNNNAIQQVLFQQSPEGRFLLNGITLPGSQSQTQREKDGLGNFTQTSGLAPKPNPIIKCLFGGPNNNTDTDPALYKITPMGYEGIYGSPITETTPINDPEKEIPGFSFLHSNKKCNPCIALNDPADDSCPFTIHTRAPR